MKIQIKINFLASRSFRFRAESFVERAAVICDQLNDGIWISVSISMEHADALQLIKSEEKAQRPENKFTFTFEGAFCSDRFVSSQHIIWMKRKKNRISNPTRFNSIQRHIFTWRLFQSALECVMNEWTQNVHITGLLLKFHTISLVLHNKAY